MTNNITETDLGLAVMQVLVTEPNHKADVRTLIRRVPDFVVLSDADRQPSDTREGEEMWEQRVRNLKSHDKTEGNVLREGFVDHPSRGIYRLTEAGHLHLKNKGFA